MIRRCREAGLPDVEFTVQDGFVTTIRRPESRPESGAARPESHVSEPESLEGRLLSVLEVGTLSKGELARIVDHTEISGRLKKLIKILMLDQMIEWTIPDKPRSRLQKYRITDNGKAHLVALRKGTAR